MGLIKKLDSFVDKFASALLVIGLLTILVCSSMSIMLRWVHVNLYWVDPFVRHLVFLCTFTGGVVATGRGSHIGIDLISKLLEIKHMDGARKVVNRVILLSSAVVLIWLFKASLNFMTVEMEFSKHEFWNIPSGYLVGIVPFGVALMTIRFTTLFLLSFSSTPPELHNLGEMP
jgi:TRAP-type C4-dicarboxylate transport system permease small subunit